MTHTEGVQLVMQPGDIPQGNRPKRLSDIRIITLGKKELPEAGGLCAHGLKYGKKRQQALIYKKILELFFKIRVGVGIDKLSVRIKHHVILRKAFNIHMVADRIRVAAVIVKGFLTETDACGFQHTGVGNRTVFTDDDIVGEAEQVMFKNITAKQLIP